MAILRGKKPLKQLHNTKNYKYKELFLVNQRYHPRATADINPLEVIEIHLRG
jgi:hypothetical protein